MLVQLYIYLIKACIGTRNQGVSWYLQVTVTSSVEILQIELCFSGSAAWLYSWCKKKKTTYFHGGSVHIASYEATVHSALDRAAS